MAEELPFLEKISRMTTKQKGRTLKYANYIRNLLSEGEVKSLIRSTVRSYELSLVLLFGVVAVVGSLSVQYGWLRPVVIGLAFVASIGFLRFLEGRVRDDVMSTARVVSNQVTLLERDVDLVQSELPRALVARIVELAGYFDAARRAENQMNERIATFQYAAKPHKTRAEILEGSPTLTAELGVAEGLVRSSKSEFWKFLGYVYDTAISGHGLTISQFPPRPTTLQEALGLKDWLYIQEMDRRDRLNISPPV